MKVAIILPSKSVLIRRIGFDPWPFCSGSNLRNSGNLESFAAQNQFEFSRHAVDQSVLRQISVQELREAFILPAAENDQFAPFYFREAERLIHGRAP